MEIRVERIGDQAEGDFVSDTGRLKYRATQDSTQDLRKYELAAGEFVLVGERNIDRREARGDNTVVNVLFMILFDIPDLYQAEFDRWFAEEHSTLLVSIEGWHRASLLRVHDAKGVRATRAALHELGDLSPLTSGERAAAGQTEWTRRVFDHPWSTSVQRFRFERAIREVS